MKTALLVILLGFLAFCSAQQQQQESNFLLGSNLLTVQGNGNAIVPANRTTFTVTLFGFGSNATSAQQALLLQISSIQNSMSGFSLLNLQLGGIMYYPYNGAPLGAATAESNTVAGQGLAGQGLAGQTGQAGQGQAGQTGQAGQGLAGQGLAGQTGQAGQGQAGQARMTTGFVASTTLSFSVNATDAALAIDTLLANGTAYISISSRPDPLAIEEAQRLAVRMAVDDAIFKAQAALSRLNLCTLNITLINIESPISLLPAVNIMSNNFGLSVGGNFGLNMPTGATTANSNPNNLGANNANNANNANSNNLPNDSLNLAGGGAGRSLVSAHVWLNLYHTSCSTSGAIQDLTANISMAMAAPGSQLGSELLGSLSLASPIGSPEILGSASASGIGSPLILGSPLELSPLGSSELASASGSAIGQIRRRRAFW